MNKDEWENNVRRQTKAAEVGAAGSWAAAAGSWATASAVRQANRDANLIGQQQIDLTQQQVEIARKQHDQTTQYQFAMWAQSPDGRAFQEWSGRAEWVAEQVEYRSDAWEGAWLQSVAESLGEDHLHRLAPYGGPATKLGDPLVEAPAKMLGGALGIGLVILFLVQDPTNPPYKVGKFVFDAVYLLVLAVIVSVFVIWAPRREKAAKEAASRERIRVFGQDPLLPGGHPHWAPGVDTDQLTIGIRDLIASAPTTLPHQSQLFPVSLPRAVNPAPSFPRPVQNLAQAMQAEDRRQDQGR